MRKRIVALLGVLALTIPLAALPAMAVPPERVDEPIFIVFLDFEHDKVVLWNITRDDLCFWADGDFVGPPPVGSPVSFQAKETGKGALVGRFHETRSLELWDLDDPSNPQDPCSDTDEQVEPWAQGHAAVSVNDNDVDVSGTRRNSFGDTGHARLTDGDGGVWHYSWLFKAHCMLDCEADFNVKAENFNLHRIGN